MVNKELIENEENLIIEQLRLEQELTRTNLFNKLSMAEQLFNLALPEVLHTSFETAESLSKNFTLPLKVKGVFLTEGRPQRKFYPRNELLKSVSNPKNGRFPIMADHRDKETSVIIGVVERLTFDNNIQLKDGSIRPGIRWWGHINSETAARNILDRVINEVSVTVYSEEHFDEKLGIAGKNLVFSELSTVIHGADAGNSIEPDLK